MDEEMLRVLTAHMAARPREEWPAAIRYLSERERRVLDDNWSLWAHDGQLPGSDDWTVWLIRAGRGFGKTRAGAEWVTAIAGDPEALIALVGATAADVVRTRVYVTDIAQWEAVGRVHGEFFGAARPASAMVEVSGLIDPAMLVEVEADAVVGA